AVVAPDNARVLPEAAGAPVAAPHSANDLSEDDKSDLLIIARDAISAGLVPQDYDPPEHDRLNFAQGLFVSLNLDGELRGCIGQIRARDDLPRAVAAMAHAAAFEDPRFDPLREYEFGTVEIEISILTPLERVREINEIIVGRDGLMIKLDHHSGLLLPQVAVDHGWNVEEFLEQTCLKAGVSRHGYKDKFAEIYKFSAVIFS
ncbi:MAG: AmmeMemoRadiSam system protein A, partial [candidate division Zixibacteria bacterium]